MNLESKKAAWDPLYSVYLTEVDATEEHGNGYEVAVTREGMPPHSREFHSSREAAEARFDELT